MSKPVDVQCREIVEHIVRICNEDEHSAGLAVGFSDDWGGNSLTVHCAGLGHSHVGDPEGTFEQLVDSLHDLLCKGRGLSFALPPEKIDDRQPPG